MELIYQMRLDDACTCSTLTNVSTDCCSRLMQYVFSDGQVYLSLMQCRHRDQ